MAGEISIQMSGDAQKLFKELAKTKAKLGEVEKKLGRVARASGKVEKSQASAFNIGSMKKFAGALTGVGGVLAAYKLITAELEHQKRLEREVLSVQMEVNRARQGLIRNLAAEDPATVKGLLSFGTKLASKTKVPQPVIFNALASAFSAAGGDLEIAKSATARAALLLPDAPGAIAATAGTLIDLSRATGSTDARYNQGYFTAISAASRITDPGALARNVPGAIIGQTNLGASPATAGALFAALTTGSADILGATSGTGSIGLVQQLKKAFPELSTIEAITKLQGDPLAAAEFTSTLSMEKKVIGPAITLLTDATSKIAKEFAAIRQTLGDRPGLLATADRSIGLRGLDPLESIAKIDRMFKSAKEALQITNIQAGTMAAAQTGIAGVLEGLGEGALSTKISGLGFDVTTRLGGQQVLNAAVQMIVDRISDLTTPRRAQTGLGAGLGIPGSRQDMLIQPTREEHEAADILRELRDATIGLAIEMKRRGTYSLGSPDVDK